MKNEIQQLWNKLDIRYKITFFSTLIMGLLCHGIALFNKFSVRDDTTYMFSVGSTYKSARWMLGFLERFEEILFGDEAASMPLFNGFGAIVLIAVSACIIVKLVSIQSEICCAFVGSIMVSFPVITGMFGYVFTIRHYMIALLMNVVGVYLICMYQKWHVYATGVFLIAASLGIYQAFLSVTCALFLMVIIDYVYSSEGDFVKSLKKGTTYIICIAVSLVSYLVINKIISRLLNIELTDYKSINTIGNAGISTYLRGVFYAYKEFLKPSSEYSYNMYPFSIRTMYYIAMFLGLIMFVWLFLKKWKQSKQKAFLFAVCIFLYPLGANLVFALGADGVHSLMVYGQVFLFVLLAWMIDKIEINGRRIRKIFSVVSCIIMVLFVCMYCRLDNRCYLKATFVQNQAISWFTTLITQIKSVEGYKDEYSVCYINEKSISDESLYIIDELQDYYIYPYDSLRLYLNGSKWKLFMKYWCGYMPEIADEDQFKELPEVKDMPSYPDCGSIKVIDETVVVKF